LSRPALEVADIFRDHGSAGRIANAGHLSLGQLKVMSAIESCRTAALVGFSPRACPVGGMSSVARRVRTCALPTCRNRHCPKCQGAAAREWLADREAELLPVPYYHVVFTLPAPIADIAYQNKAVVYGVLFKACPCCGGRMIIVETFECGCTPRYRHTVPSGSTAHDRHRPVTTPNVDHTRRLSSIGCQLIRPKTRAVPQLIPSMMAIATGSMHRHALPPLRLIRRLPSQRAALSGDGAGI
jgi:hypothetical protein